MFSLHFVNQRQPEIVEETRNTYITETISDRIEILTGNLESSSVGKWLQHEIIERSAITATAELLV